MSPTYAYTSPFRGKDPQEGLAEGPYGPFKYESLRCRKLAAAPSKGWFVIEACEGITKTTMLTRTPGPQIGLYRSFIGIKYRGTSLIRNSAPLGTYGSNMPRALWRPSGGGLFLVSEVSLQL